MIAATPRRRWLRVHALLQVHEADARSHLDAGRRGNPEPSDGNLPSYCGTEHRISAVTRRDITGGSGHLGVRLRHDNAGDLASTDQTQPRCSCCHHCVRDQMEIQRAAKSIRGDCMGRERELHRIYCSVAFDLSAQLRSPVV